MDHLAEFNPLTIRLGGRTHVFSDYVFNDGPSPFAEYVGEKRLGVAKRVIPFTEHATAMDIYQALAEHQRELEEKLKVH